MALAAQQSLLDELMGRGRNATKGEIIPKHRFDDPKVCKYMLVDYCPHDLFVNTRHDLGHCEKIHDSHLQEDYQKSSRYGKLGYEKEFGTFLKALVSDVDRRIKRGQERLRLTQGSPYEDIPKSDTMTRIKSLEDKITLNVLKSEKLGNDCQIDEAQQVLNECEEMREEKRKLELQLIEEQANKSMEVCTVCGSFLIIGDIQSRVDEHISGKQHAGYAKIRATLDEFVQRKKGPEVEKEDIRYTQISNRKRERSKSKDEKSKRHHHHHRSSRHENTSSSNHRR